MSERTSSKPAAGIWAFMVAVTAAGLVLQMMTLHAVITPPFAFRGVEILLNLAVGSVGALIATRRRENPIGWLLLAASVASAFAYVGAQYTMLSLDKHQGSLPFTLGAAWFSNWLWVPLVGLIGIYSVALFPDGRAFSAAWSRFLRFFVPIALVVFAVGIAFAPGQMQGLAPGFNNPYAVSRNTGSLLGAVGGLLFVASFVGAVVSLVRRFRRSSGIVREQLKWLVLAASGVAVTLAIGMPVYLGVQGSSSTYASTGVDIVSIAIAVSILGIPVAMGIAILRYRLWDIDVVINKAVVFGALAAAITAIYVGIVVGIGAAVGSTGRPNVGLSVAATAAVAVLIQPLRAWARRVANRVVYGKRATPHDVLTVLGERISEAYSLDEVLPRLARLVTEATAASHAEVWLRVGGELRQTAAWPDDPSPGATVPVPPDGSATLPGAEHSFAVRHQAELLGVIAVRTPHNESLTSSDERLLTDLSSHAGLVLRNLRLFEELRASRQRLVSAQDAERRKIERNLHDGAQQHLVALAINLRLAQTMLDGDLAQARDMLQQIQSEAGEALENLRDLARGIYPPLLADRGLAAALTSHAAKAPVPTTVEAGVIGRHPMEVEAAVYFCVLEALQNVSKYAHASSAIVRVTESNGHLEFAVSDDGAGFDAATVTRGAGLTNMTDRIEALGGRIEVASRPGAGTTIRGFVTSSPVS